MKAHGLENLCRAATRSLAGECGRTRGFVFGLRRSRLAEVSDAENADPSGACGGAAGGNGRAHGVAQLGSKMRAREISTGPGWDASQIPGNNSFAVNSGNRSAKPLLAGSIPARASKSSCNDTASGLVPGADFSTTYKPPRGVFPGSRKAPSRFFTNAPKLWKSATFGLASHPKMGRVPHLCPILLRKRCPVSPCGSAPAGVSPTHARRFFYGSPLFFSLFSLARISRHAVLSRTRVTPRAGHRHEYDEGVSG